MIVSDNGTELTSHAILGWQEERGDKGLRLHDLRHEAVSRLFEKGLTTEEVMSVSGHTIYAMLARYTHLRATSLVEKLG